MKNILPVLIIIVLCAVLQWFLPWWIIVLPCFGVGFLFASKKAIPSFLQGFLGVFLLWAAYSIFITIQNDNILANRMSLLIFKFQSTTLIIIASALIGGIVAGLAALSGFYLREKL